MSNTSKSPSLTSPTRVSAPPPPIPPTGLAPPALTPECVPPPSKRGERPILRGWIKTTADALLVLEASRTGAVPRVRRRFHELEKREIITSGAILVFAEEESGIKRWTDPFLWSASRMQGHFLMYREREDHNAVDTESPYHCAAMPIAPASPTGQIDPELEHYILGSWNTGRGLKENGLMKKTISMIIEGSTYHLVSYYYPSDVRSGALQTPTSMPHLSGITISDAVLNGLSELTTCPGGKVKRGRPARGCRSSREIYARPTREKLILPVAPRSSHSSPIDCPAPRTNTLPDPARMTNSDLVPNLIYPSPPPSLHTPTSPIDTRPYRPDIQPSYVPATSASYEITPDAHTSRHIVPHSDVQGQPWPPAPAYDLGMYPDFDPTAAPTASASAPRHANDQVAQWSAYHAQACAQNLAPVLGLPQGTHDTLGVHVMRGSPYLCTGMTGYFR